ncbi:hypothetical protein SO802_011513 [Lithocarpus litseifolius]|uniref:RNase H type-1 domain-containing protein n=1 Tax=Lithocarpus litseifolius TaxID=425828 RepID=A0AAW2D082_9ROSI
MSRGIIFFSLLAKEFILKWRNHDDFERKSISHEGLHRGLSRIFLEHWSVLKSYHQSDKSRANSQWCMPASGLFKLNCDAAVHSKHSVIVVVARDWRGNWVLAHTENKSTNIQVQAQAEALRWSVCLASNKNLQKVLIRR